MPPQPGRVVAAAAPLAPAAVAGAACAGVAGLVGAGAARLVTIPDCLPNDKPPPKRLAEAMGAANSTAMANITHAVRLILFSPSKATPPKGIGKIVERSLETFLRHV